MTKFGASQHRRSDTNKRNESGMKRISRKRFLHTSAAGIAGLGLLRSLKAEEVMQMQIPLRKMGNTGIQVSPLCFGASRTNQPSLIEQALRSGLNFLDTGRAYAQGRNEELVGKVIKGKRKEVVVQSKIYLKPEEVGGSYTGRKARQKIHEALQTKLDQSLKALQTDYIDILLVHNAEDMDLVFNEYTLEFFNNIKQKGIIRAHGFSVHREQVAFMEKQNQTSAYDVVLVAFNHKGSFVHSLSNWDCSWDQQALIRELTKAHQSGTGIVAMKTCSGGPLSVNGEEASFAAAVNWVQKQEYVHSAAVAIANYTHLKEHLDSLNS